MRVLVINRSKRVLILGIQAQQNVVFVRRSHKEPAELQLAGCQVGLRLQRLKALLIFGREYNDGRYRIDINLGKECLKHPAHPLELISNVAGLLLVRVGEHSEMGTAHFKPLFG